MPTPKLLATLFVLALPALAAAQGPPPANVRIDAARSETLTQLRGVTGDIRSTRRSLIASQVEGLVVELTLDEGDVVEEGHVIARLDDTTATLDVQQATAVLAAARASVDEERALLHRAQRDLERVLEAERRGSSSETEIDRFRTDVAAFTATLARAEADVEAAAADLGRKQKDLADMTIRAPFAGAVVSKHAEVGEWVAIGDTLLEIVSLTEIEARIEVPEHMVRFLDAGMNGIGVDIPALGPDADISAALIGIVPLADELSRLFPARLRVPDDKGLLRPGMSLTAFIPTGRVEPTLTVHKDAVLRDDAGEFVYMAMPSGGGGPGGPPPSQGAPAGPSHQAVPARITRLYAVGDRVAIRPGQIRPGSLVVIEGNERVFPTQPLIILNPPPAQQDSSQDAPQDAPGARAQGS